MIGLGSTPYTINFSISSLYNQTQDYSFRLFVWNRTSYIVNGLNQTAYSHSLSSAPWRIYYGQNVTFDLSYIDVDNNNRLISSAYGNLTLYNGTAWSSVIEYTDFNGHYYFNLNKISQNLKKDNILMIMR